MKKRIPSSSPNTTRFTASVQNNQFSPQHPRTNKKRNFKRDNQKKRDPQNTTDHRFLVEYQLASFMEKCSTDLANGDHEFDYSEAKVT